MIKEIKVECKHCSEEIPLTLHWANEYNFITCKSCGRENKFEIKNWEIKNKKK
jgi:transcription elongation factor Elf1